MRKSRKKSKKQTTENFQYVFLVLTSNAIIHPTYLIIYSLQMNTLVTVTNYNTLVIIDSL